jgi:WD40 repeat protein
VIRSLAWSRDGRRLASAGDEGAVKVWDVAAGKETLSFPYSRPPRDLAVSSAPPAESLMAWSADGGQLAVAGGDGAVTVRDVLTDKAAVLLPRNKAVVASVAWSPDGRRLASTGDDGTVSLWDPSTGQEVLTLRFAPAQGERPGAVAWSPDGRRLAVAGAGRMVGRDVTIWDPGPAAGTPGSR